MKSKLSVLVVVATLLLTFTAALPRAAALAGPTNVQFHIGCSSFTASADATNGFGFFVSGPGLSSAGSIQSGSGHIVISSSYGKTFPQGTLLFYIYGDVSVPTGEGVVACSDSGFQGPGIPAGFVLQTITCNTPVYANPGGTPVNTGEAIKVGQTWYVSPVAVKDAKGNSWTEIFVSSYNDPFIPTSCLGGAPAK